jgi:hypothetical protein
MNFRYFTTSNLYKKNMTYFYSQREWDLNIMDQEMVLVVISALNVVVKVIVQPLAPGKNRSEIR